MNANIPVEKNKITTTIKEKDSIPKTTELATRSPDTKDDWYTQKEYVIFKNQFQSMKKNNIVILKESKENKRLLDLKYDDLNNQINMIQTSVIFFSTISGFLQATKEFFNTENSIVTVSSISISTYISPYSLCIQIFKDG